MLGRRSQVLWSALRAELPELPVAEPRGGYFVWLPLPPGVDATALLEAAEPHGLRFTPGPRCAVERDLSGFVRLSFAFYDEAELREGVRRLATVLRETTQPGRPPAR